MPNNLSIDPTRDGFHDRYDVAIALPMCSEEPNDNADLYLPDDGLTASPPAFTIPRSWRTETLVEELPTDITDPALATALSFLTLLELTRALEAIDRDYRSSDPKYIQFFHALLLRYRYSKALYDSTGEPSHLRDAMITAKDFINFLPKLGDQQLPPDWIGEVTLYYVEHLVANHDYSGALAVIERITTQVAAPERDPAWHPVMGALYERAGDLHLHLLNGTEGAERYEHLNAAYRSYLRAAIALVMEGEGAIDLAEHRRLTERLLQIADRARSLSPPEHRVTWEAHVALHQGELNRLSNATSAPASLTSKEVLPQALERGLAQNPGRSVKDVQRDLAREAAEGEAAQARDSHTRGGEAGRQEYALDLTGKRPRR